MSSLFSSSQSVNPFSSFRSEILFSLPQSASLLLAVSCPEQQSGSEGETWHVVIRHYRGMEFKKPSFWEATCSLHQ